MDIAIFITMQKPEITQQAVKNQQTVVLDQVVRFITFYSRKFSWVFTHLNLIIGIFIAVIIMQTEDFIETADKV